MTSRLRTAALALVLVAASARIPLRAQTTPPPTSTPAAAPQQEQTSHEYSLPPDKLKKAVEYSQARYWIHFIGSLWSVAVLLVILAFGLGAKFRDWAESASKRRFVQALIFIPLLVLANDVLNLPLGIYGQHLELAFEQ